MHVGGVPEPLLERLGQPRDLAGCPVVEHGAKTGAGQNRIVYVDEDTLAVLKAWRKVQLAERLAWGPAYQGAGYIVAQEDGQPYHPDYLTKSFTRAARKAELAGTKLNSPRLPRLRADLPGADVSWVSKAMGHKNIAVTNDTYGHLFEQGAKDLADLAQSFVPRRRTV